MKINRFFLCMVFMICIIPSVFAASYSFTDSDIYEGPITTNHPFAKAYETEVTFYSYGEIPDQAHFDGVIDQVLGNPAPPLFTSIFTCSDPTSYSCYNSVFKGQNPGKTSFFIEMEVTDDSDTIITKETYFNGNSNLTTIADIEGVSSDYSNKNYIDLVRFPVSYPLVSFNRITYRLYKDMSSVDETTFIFGAGKFAGIKIHAPSSNDGAVCKYLRKELIVDSAEKIQNISSTSDRIYQMSYDIFDLNSTLVLVLIQIIKIGLFIVALGGFLYVVLFVVKIIKGGIQ